VSRRSWVDRLYLWAIAVMLSLVVAGTLVRLLFR
jgi:hypothetical protein